MKFPDKKESYTLESLFWGLSHLASLTQAIEAETKAALYPPRESVSLAVMEMGGGSHNNELYNYFTWYANSLIPFLKLFEKAYNVREDYKLAFPKVLKWRHKVAAHLAYTDPKGDNIPSQDMSLMMCPEFELDAYWVGRLVIGRWAGQTPESSYNDWDWSLTKTHSDLLAFVARNVR
jgi:hypothetical protein